MSPRWLESCCPPYDISKLQPFTASVDDKQPCSPTLFERSIVDHPSTELSVTIKSRLEGTPARAERGRWPRRCWGSEQRCNWSSRGQDRLRIGRLGCVWAVSVVQYERQES